MLACGTHALGAQATGSGLHHARQATYPAAAAEVGASSAAAAGYADALATLMRPPLLLVLLVSVHAAAGKRCLTARCCIKMPDVAPV